MQIKWGTHVFDILEHGADWREVGGVYVFSGQISNGNWIAIYVGQTDNFRRRIPKHEQWFPAVRLGASHVHAVVVPQEATRLAIEKRLIEDYGPPLNVQHA